MESPRAGSVGRAPNNSASRRHQKSLTGGPTMEQVQDKGPRMRSETHTFKPDLDNGLHLQLARKVPDQSLESVHRRRTSSICSGSVRNHHDATRSLRPPLVAGELLPRTRILLKGQGIYLREFFAERRGVLFGGPGAFTPTCSERHLVGFRDQAHQIKAAGIDFIGCIYSNDPYVLKAWARVKRIYNHFTFISDVEGRLASALGMLTRSRARGLGQRPRRFAMVIGLGGRVEWSNVDNDCFVEDVLKFLGLAPVPVAEKGESNPPPETTYVESESSEGPIADDSSSESMSEAAAQELAEEFSSQEILIGRWRAQIMEASVRVDDLTKIPLTMAVLGRGAAGDHSVCLNYNTQPSQHTISHTAQGIRVSVEIGHGLDGFGVLRFDGRNYIATEFHVVGPSPHVLDNKPSFQRPLELRIVHHPAPDQKETSRSQLLVLAVTFTPPPLTASERDNVLAINPFLGQILDIPTLAPEIYEVFQVGRRALPGGGFNLNELIPSDASFFNYKGVLSALGERVAWLVMKQPLSLSRLQLHALQRYCPSYPSQVKTPSDAFALAHVYRFLPKLKNIRAQSPAVIVEALRKKMYVMAQLDSSLTTSVLYALSEQGEDIAHWLFAFRHKLEEHEKELCDLKGIIDKALEAYPLDEQALKSICRATDRTGELKSTYLSRFLVPDDVSRLCRALDETEFLERGVRVGTMATSTPFSTRDPSPSRSVTAPIGGLDRQGGSHSDVSEHDRYVRPRVSYSQGSAVETARSNVTSAGFPSRRGDSSVQARPPRKGLQFVEKCTVAEETAKSVSASTSPRSLTRSEKLRSAVKTTHVETSSSSADSDTASSSDEIKPRKPSRRTKASHSSSTSEASQSSSTSSSEEDSSSKASSSESASGSTESSSEATRSDSSSAKSDSDSGSTSESTSQSSIVKLRVQQSAVRKGCLKQSYPASSSSDTHISSSCESSDSSSDRSSGIEVASTHHSSDTTSESGSDVSSSDESSSDSDESSSDAPPDRSTDSSESDSNTESAASDDSIPRAKGPKRGRCKEDNYRMGCSKSTDSKSIGPSCASVKPSRPVASGNEPDKPRKKGGLKQKGLTLNRTSDQSSDASRALTEAQVELAQFMMKKLKRSSSADCTDDVTTANTAANLKTTQISNSELAALHKRDKAVKRLKAKSKHIQRRRRNIRFNTDTPQSVMPDDPDEEEWSAFERKRDREIRLRRRKPTGHPNLGDQVAKMLKKLTKENDSQCTSGSEADEGPRFTPPSLSARPKRGALKTASPPVKSETRLKEKATRGKTPAPPDSETESSETSDSSRESTISDSDSRTESSSKSSSASESSSSVESEPPAHRPVRGRLNQRSVPNRAAPKKHQRRQPTPSESSSTGASSTGATSTDSEPETVVKNRKRGTSISSASTVPKRNVLSLGMSLSSTSTVSKGTTSSRGSGGKPAVPKSRSAANRVRPNDELESGDNRKNSSRKVGSSGVPGHKVNTRSQNSELPRTIKPKGTGTNKANVPSLDTSSSAMRRHSDYVFPCLTIPPNSSRTPSSSAVSLSGSHSGGAYMPSPSSQKKNSAKMPRVKNSWKADVIVEKGEQGTVRTTIKVAGDSAQLSRDEVKKVLNLIRSGRVEDQGLRPLLERSCRMMEHLDAI